LLLAYKLRCMSVLLLHEVTFSHLVTWFRRWLALELTSADIGVGVKYDL